MLYPDRPAEDALECLQEFADEAVAVVDRAGPHRILGVVAIGAVRSAFGLTENA